MNKLMASFMLSCRRANELSELRQHQRLSLRQHTQLRMHLAVCSACRAFEQQRAVIEELGRGYLTQTAPETQSVELSDLEARIQRHLDSLPPRP